MKKLLSPIVQCLMLLGFLVLSGAVFAADAAPAASSKTIITPEAAAVLSKVKTSYGQLNSLQMSGNLTGDFEVDGQKQNPSTSFTSSFVAPNKFRHDMKDQGVIGSTGDQLYIYARDRYLTFDAPKSRTMADQLPAPLPDLLGAQNLSLVLAISSDAAADLTHAYDNVSRVADVKLEDKPYTALRLVRQQDNAVLQVLIDPTTNLLRRATIDMSGNLSARGAKDVKKATVMIDYTKTTPNAPIKPETFAWSPPAGAKDAKTMAADDSGPAGELVGKPAPDFKLKSLDDKEIALSSLKGSVVVLDFWATWCGPCVASLPHIDKLSQEMKSKGVQVFGVNQGETKDQVSEFIKAHKLTLAVLLDTDSKVGGSYKAEAIPETVVIGKDGNVQKVFVGAGPDTEQQIHDAVEAALKAP